jgi:hypothetical protein
MLVDMHIPAQGMLFPHGIAQFFATVPTVSLASTQGSVGPSWQPAAGAAAVFSLRHQEAARDDRVDIGTTAYGNRADP